LLVLLGTLVVPLAIQMIAYDYEMPYRFVDVIGYFVCFMPFMVNIRFGHHLLEPLWSIGVEEIFYLLWAPLFKWIKKHLLFLIFAVIFCKLTLSVIIWGCGTTNIFTKITGMLQFEAMAVGALGAYLVFSNKINFSRNILFSKTFQIICYIFLICRILAANYLQEWTIFKVIFTAPVFSGYLLIFAFMWLIINVSLNEKSFLKLRGKTLNFLGEISYGIYMYHMLVIFCIALILRNILTNLNLFLSSLIFYTLLTGGVILVSYLSKKYFENYFLGLKHKFSS
jgi:peptidoglycan/LPS O-acetylase OafA/YrhL